MHWIDWLIVAAVVTVMAVIAWGTRRLTRSVADFLAANRSAGRYLLTTASGMSGIGAISIVADFEKFYEAGFAAVWWEQILAPLMLILALSGFVIYRYRETRVLTMAQFFEVRYSRRFRIFAGLLAFLSGILNYGIFPAVTSRFIVYFIGLPVEFAIGGWVIPTIAPVMLVMLGLALVLTLSGGQVAVMITDFLQGQFVQIAIVAVFVVLMWKVGWSDMIDGLRQAPPEASRINPFRQGQTEGFNVWFFLMLAFVQVYSFRAWQGSQAYNASAKTPHEAKMAGILSEFRTQIFFLLMMLVPVFIFAVFHLPQYADTAASAQATLDGISDETIRTQMRVPVGLREMLPVGVAGMFLAMIIAAAVSTDDTYLHSWGCIFIQDVLMPFRKSPLSPKAHLRLLRVAIFGVAVFGFTFSLLFPLNEFIFMYFMITGAIYLGGAGAVILGGLYWNRGTVEGAWAAMGGGSALAVAGIVLRNIFWPYYLLDLKASWTGVSWVQKLPDEFPLDGMQMAFGSALVSVLLYVVVSLLSKREPVDMDRLLHRGKWAVEDDGHHPQQRPSLIGPVPAEPPVSLPWREKLSRRLGINDDFTRGDKAIYVFKIVWVLFFFGVFIVGNIAAAVITIPEAWWVKWWAIKVTLAVTVGIGISIWFLIGGFRDLFEMIRTLRAAAVIANDDGSVASEEHLQLDDSNSAR